MRGRLIGLTVLVGFLTGLARGTDRTQAATSAHPPGSSYVLPHNYYGAHLLVNDGGTGTGGEKHLRWARHLVGRWGYAKTLLGGIDKNTQGPARQWIDYVNKCYELEMIPVLRLAGHFGEGRWGKPEADAPGDYTSLAQAVKRVVEGFPRSAMCPLYIEVWNEPNLDVEWSGQTNPKEYADFFVAVSKAIRSIGDDRIKILNGGLATSPEWARELCEANPDFINAFDVWSCHPYPMNRPPWLNHHDKTVPPDADLAIDSYVLELAELAKKGRSDVKVIITETGWDLGNNVYAEGKPNGHPIIDEYNRADYAVRAFRDYWSKWPEIIAVLPFEFCSQGWERFDWVYPGSGINPDGSPTRPHYQYTAVAALAKPTDATGAINGTVTVAGLGVRLDGASVSIPGQSVRTDPRGNFFLARVKPGPYTVTIAKTGFKRVTRQVEVTQGQNTIVDVELEAKAKASLVGTVRSGDDGKPIAGATVTLEPGSVTARTDKAGRYEFKDQIPAGYRLIAKATGCYTYEAKDVQLAPGKPAGHDFVLGTLPARLPQEDLAKNTSMEAGGGGGGKDWVALCFEPLQVSGDANRAGAGSVDTTNAHTGQRSQEIKLFPQETVIRQITHYNTVKPGTRHLGGIWIRTDCPADGGAWITFDATNNAGDIVKRIGTGKRISGKTEWQWVPLEGIAPKGSARLSLNLHTQGSGGVAFFDDATIGAVSDPKPSKEE